MSQIVIQSLHAQSGPHFQEYVVLLRDIQEPWPKDKWGGKGNIVLPPWLSESVLHSRRSWLNKRLISLEHGALIVEWTQSTELNHIWGKGQLFSKNFTVGLLEGSLEFPCNILPRKSLIWINEESLTTEPTKRSCKCSSRLLSANARGK